MSHTSEAENLFSHKAIFLYVMTTYFRLNARNHIKQARALSLSYHAISSAKKRKRQEGSGLIQFANALTVAASTLENGKTDVYLGRCVRPILHTVEQTDPANFLNIDPNLLNDEVLARNLKQFSHAVRTIVAKRSFASSAKAILTRTNDPWSLEPMEPRSLPNNPIKQNRRRWNFRFGGK